MVKLIEIPISARKKSHFNLHLKWSNHSSSRFFCITHIMINWPHFVIITHRCHFSSICTTQLLQLCHLYLSHHSFLPFDAFSASCLVLGHIKTWWNQTNRMKKQELWATKSSGRLVKSDVGWQVCASQWEDIFTGVTVKPSTVWGEANGWEEQPATAMFVAVTTRVAVMWKPLKHCICNPATCTVILWGPRGGPHHITE